MLKNRERLSVLLASDDLQRRVDGCVCRWWSFQLAFVLGECDGIEWCCVRCRCRSGSRRRGRLGATSFPARHDHGMSEQRLWHVEQRLRVPCWSAATPSPTRSHRKGQTHRCHRTITRATRKLAGACVLSPTCLARTACEPQCPLVSVLQQAPRPRLPRQLSPDAHWHMRGARDDGFGAGIILAAHGDVNVPWLVKNVDKVLSSMITSGSEGVDEARDVVDCMNALLALCVRAHSPSCGSTRSSAGRTLVPLLGSSE